MRDKLEWLNWFWKFLCEGLSSFNLKGFCYSYAWSCSWYERRYSHSTGLFPRRICSFLFLTDFTSFSVLLLFLYHSPSSSLCTVFNAILSNIHDVPLINPSANMFVFGDFNIHHKDWPTYFGGTNSYTWWTLLKFFYLRWWMFLLKLLFLSSDTTFFSATAFSPFEISDHVVVRVSIDILSNSKQNVWFNEIVYDYSHAD